MINTRGNRDSEPESESGERVSEVEVFFPAVGGWNSGCEYRVWTRRAQGQNVNHSVWDGGVCQVVMM